MTTEFNPNETQEEKARGIQLAKERSMKMWTRVCIMYSVISLFIKLSFYSKYNSGFIDDTAEWCSTSKATYTASQFTLLKDPDAEDLTHHRKKNEVTVCSTCHFFGNQFQILILLFFF